MALNTLELTNRLYEELKNSELFSGQSVSFSKGFPGVARTMFPFITVGYPGYREKSIGTASGILTYSFEIFVGAKSLAPGAALNGSANKDGIHSLCEKTRAVIVKTTLSGLLSSRPYNIRLDTDSLSTSGSASIIGKVLFDADVWRYYL